MKNSIIATTMLTAMLATQTLGAVTDLTAGSTVSLNGITSAEDTSLPGLVTEDSVHGFVILDDSGGELYRASLQSRITTRFDTGELDFQWRIRDVFDREGQVSSVVISGFAGWELGVEYRVDGSGDIGPSDALRTADDERVGYLFTNLLTPIEESKFFFARTHAYEYDMSGTVRINLISGEFVEFATWAPAVPAPASMGLLGLSGLIAMRRRR